MKNIFLIIVGLVACLMPLNFAKAQSGLIVSPPLKEHALEKGKSVSETIKVTNPTEDELIIEITLADFKAQGEEGAQEFITDDNNYSYSLSKWLKLDEEKFNLKSKQTKEIKYTIEVPTTAEPGGHYGVVFFTPVQTVNQNTSGALVVPKVGSLILGNVEGEVTVNASIKEFTTKNFYTNLSNTVNFLTRVENEGNTHIKPQGNIIVKNIFGSQITQIQVNPKTGSILPDSIKKFENDYYHKYGFGMYTASLNLNYDGHSLNSETNFYIVPIKEAGILLLAIVLIIIIRNFIKKRKTSIS